MVDEPSSGVMMILSGGGVSKKSCGEPRFVAICPDHKDEMTIYHDKCNRLQCPVCMESKAQRLAHAAEDRIHGLRNAYQDQGIKLGRLKHVSFNKDPQFCIEDDIIDNVGKDLNKEFGNLLKRSFKDGFYAGCAVFHPYRKKHLDGTECREGKECDRPHDWVFGPHFHFIGYGYVERADSFSLKNHWTYHNIEDNERGRNVYATVFYELTHAGIFLDEYGKQINQVVRWLGAFSNAKGGKRKVETTYEYVLCKICGRPLQKYGYDSYDEHKCNWNYDQGEYQKRVDKYEYYLVKKQKIKKQIQF